MHNKMDVSKVAQNGNVAELVDAEKRKGDIAIRGDFVRPGLGI